MDDPTEISRRKFMANCTVGIGTAIGLGLAIPVAGALVPEVSEGSAAWTRLDQRGWKELQELTKGAVQINVSIRGKDAYLPEEIAPQSLWGIKVKDPKEFVRDRPDLFTSDGKSKLPYDFMAMGFVLFSGLCPHLNCPYNFVTAANRFICTCHGSQYDENGAHVAGPAARGLDPLPLREHNGVAEVEWIRYLSTIPNRIVVSYLS